MNEKLKKTIKKVIQSNVYRCGCGKDYQSLPAFLTHCKSKHQRKKNGPYPKGSILPKKKSCKRGRPKSPRSKENAILGSESQYSDSELFLKENKSQIASNQQNFLKDYCDEIQLKSMELDCIDDILIFLTELNVEYCISQIGEKRVNIQEIWENEISKENPQLAPNLFAVNLDINSIEFIFQQFLRIVSVDLKVEIIKEFLIFFAVLCEYFKKIGKLRLSKLQEFPNLQWKRWKQNNTELLSNCEIVGKQTYDMINENVEFLVHFFIEYLIETRQIRQMTY